jgi:hypothetical protein
MAQKNLPDDFWQQLLEAATPLVQQAGQRVASGVPAEMNADVRMKKDKGGKPVALVAMRVPQARAAEAKHGYLIQSAVSSGLDIHRYGG